MIYPENFEEKIGFDQIRQLTINKCVSSLGIECVENTSFSNDIKILNELLGETEEFRQILLFDNPFPSQDYYDLKEEIHRIRVDGSYLETEELGMLKSVLITIKECLNYIIHRGEEKYPILFIKASSLIFDEQLIHQIDRIIDDKSTIKDNASENLREIRKSLSRNMHNATRKTMQCLKDAKKSGLIKDDAEVTIRNGRLVIPVPAANKRKVKGFIHDESASGQTVFIEPQEVIEDNNDIRDLMNAEKREIIQILIEITKEIRFQSEMILSSLSFLGKIDFIRAKAKMAIDINGIKPNLYDVPFIDWKKAVHPLLSLKFKPLKKTVVPLDIKLDDKQRILIISGPNAGGKSVCLKTVGLVQYMIQCGFLVPVHEISEFGIFDQLFIDMGDEQSIENDLSTYSSHLRNMMKMVEKGDKKTLLLIDEMGSGTEPILGGAMAEAIVTSLHKNESFGVITTHYGNLKRLASVTDGLINGAMLFDMEQLTPMFMLKTGIQGSSFTFEIAKKIGFPEAIIQSAKELINTPQYDFEIKSQQLETELVKLAEEKKTVEAADNFLAELIQKYDSLKKQLENDKSRILKEANKKALQIIKESNALVEKTIREIKESKAEKTKVAEVRNEIEKKKAELSDSIKVETPTLKTTTSENTENQNTPTEFKVGDPVFIPEIDTQALILELLKDNKVVLDINGVIFRTELEKLEPISRSESKQLRKNPSTSSTIYKRINEKANNFKPSIDVRGKRAEEALSETDKLIDDAVQLGFKELKILHGKGTGVLRKVIRELLSKNPFVEHFEDEKIEMGGHGITVVRLK